MQSQIDLLLDFIALGSQRRRHVWLSLSEKVTWFLKFAPEKLELEAASDFDLCPARRNIDPSRPQVDGLAQAVKLYTVFQQA